jgi:hypothetical protein
LTGRKLKSRLLTQKPNEAGYLLVSLGSTRSEQKSRLVHRLVALVFLDNPEDKPYVNHKNGIKSDPTLGNLEWSTASENSIHAHETGLQKNAEGVDSKNFKGLVYCQRQTGGEITSYAGPKELRAAGFHAGHVYQVVLGNTKHHKRYKFWRE